MVAVSLPIQTSLVCILQELVVVDDARPRYGFLVSFGNTNVISNLLSPVSGNIVPTWPVVSPTRPRQS